MIENVLHRFTEVIRIPSFQSFLTPEFKLIDVILSNRAKERVSLEGEARRSVFEHALMNSGQMTIGCASSLNLAVKVGFSSHIPCRPEEMSRQFA